MVIWMFGTLCSRNRDFRLFSNVLKTSSSIWRFSVTSYSLTFETSSVWLNPRPSPLSPTRAFNKSFSTLIARIGFSDASRILRRILPHCSNSQTTTLSAVGTCVFLSWALGSNPWLFSSRALAPDPSCSSFFTSIWHLFHQTFCSAAESGSSSFQVNLQAHALADMRFSVCHCCRRRLRSGLCFMLQARAAECCLRRPAPSHGHHDSTSHKPPAMALHGFTASLRASPPSVTSHVT